MTIKKLHAFTGCIITIFVGLHLFNHSLSIISAEKHIEMMHTLRLFYRNGFVEILLFNSVIVQIISGIILFRANQKKASFFFEKIHVWTGLYLAIFFIIHISAVLVGRVILHLDTNFYFGVTGLNVFPFNLFFIPYYGLAIFSFFGHIAAIHSTKMKYSLLKLSPKNQAMLLLIFGFILNIIILYGLTNHFNGVSIPKEYQILVGKRQ